MSLRLLFPRAMPLRAPNQYTGVLNYEQWSWHQAETGLKEVWGNDKGFCTNRIHSKTCTGILGVDSYGATYKDLGAKAKVCRMLLLVSPQQLTAIINT